MRTCERCCERLREGEEIVCDRCMVATCERLLASPRWAKVRGPFVGEEIRRDLRAAQSRLANRRGR
jgi:hypothetical protein